MSEQSEAFARAMDTERQALVASLLLEHTHTKSSIIAAVSAQYGVSAQTVRVDIAKIQGPGSRTDRMARHMMIADLLAAGLPLRVLIPQVAEDFGVKEATVRKDLDSIGAFSENLLKRRQISEAKIAACYDRLETLASQGDHKPAAVKANGMLLKEYGQRRDRMELEKTAAELSKVRVQLAQERIKLTVAQTEVAQKVANKDGDLLGDVTVILGALAGQPSDRDLEDLGATRADLVDPMTEGD